MSSLAEKDEILGLDFEEDAEHDSFETQSPLEILKPIALILGSLSIATLLLLLIFRRPKSSTISSHFSDTLLPTTPHYLTTFQRACSLIGQPMPPGRTLRQQLETLDDQELSPDFAPSLLSYHYDVTYGAKTQHKRTEKNLVSQLKQWERRMTSGKKD